MFENIIGHNDITTLLSQDVSNDSLPRALLFEGPPSSAKLSAALELARVVSCHGGGEWNCGCPNCARHRILAQEDIALLGSKSFTEELRLAARIADENPSTPSARYFFIRSAKKLLKRFDPFLYTGEEGKLGKAEPAMRAVLELLDTEAAIDTQKTLAHCQKLTALLPDAPPVFQIRAMEYWTRLKPLGEKKIIIIEHADRMQVSSQNALLKILEEPPPHTIFVLTTTRRQAITQTISSRLRPYRFLKRSKHDEAAVIERVFKANASDAESVSDYLARFRTTPILGLELTAERFAAAMLSNNAAECAAAIREAGKITDNFGSDNESGSCVFEAFIHAGGLAVSGKVKQGGLAEQRDAELYASLAREAITYHASYNMQAAALLERLASFFMRRRAKVMT